MTPLLTSTATGPREVDVQQALHRPGCMQQNTGQGHGGQLPVLICSMHAGVEDLICNWLGNQRWVDLLPWSGVHGWKAAPEKAWAVDAKTVGSVRSYGGLSFVKVCRPAAAAGAAALFELLPVETCARCSAGSQALWPDSGCWCCTCWCHAVRHEHAKHGVKPG